MSSRLVLVVEDDPAIARLICFYVREAGWNPLHAANGLRALQLFAQQAPALVLLDVMLPDVSGWELCAMLRQSSAVPIMMLTGKSADHDIVHGLTLGADDYLGKPFSGAQLVARIEALMRRGSPSAAPGDASAAPDDAPPASPSAAPPASPSGPAPHPGGAALREARLAAKLSLHQIERLTGIRWDYAQAMELSQFAAVPRPLLRDLLLKYCVFLRIDARPVFEHTRRVLMEPDRRERPVYQRLSFALLIGAVVILILLPLMLG